MTFGTALRTLPLLALLALAGRGIAQERPAPTPISSIAEIGRRISALEQSALADKEQIIAVYGEALRELESERRFAELATASEQEARDAPARLQAVRAELEQPADTAEPEAPAQATSRDLEQRQQQAEADRGAAQRAVDELTRQLAAAAERQAALPEEIAGLVQAVAESREAAAALTGDDEAALARRTKMQAQLARQSAELRAKEAERAKLDAQRELLPLLRDRARRQLARADRLATLWQARTAERRDEEALAAQAAAEHQRELTASHPVLREIAARNEELAAQRSGPNGVSKRLGEEEQARNADRQKLEALKSSKVSTVSKVEAGRLTEGTGELLRSVFDRRLPPTLLPTLAREAASCEKRLSRVALQELLLKEEREEKSDLPAELQGLLARLGAGADAEVTQLARELLTTQAALRDALIADLDALSNVLAERKKVLDEMAREAVEFRAYIEEHILWVRSASRTPFEDAAAYAGGFAWLTGDGWDGISGRVGRVIGEHSALSGFVSLVVLALIVLRPWINRRILRLSEQVRSYRTDRYSYTLRALVATFAKALPEPLLLGFAGWLLAGTSDAEDQVASALGQAMQRVAIPLCVATFLYQTAQEKQLGEAHFRWPAQSMAILRTELRWLVPVMLPLNVAAMTFEHQVNAAWRDSIGRLAFVGSAAMLAVLMFRLFRPGSAFRDYYRREHTLLERTHKLWFAGLFGIPLLLIALAMSGYYYTAIRLAEGLRSSIGLAVALVLVHALLLRWLFVARRRLAVAQARQRAQARAEQAGQPDAAARETAGMATEEEEVDIPHVDAQTRRLFRSGMTVAALVGLFAVWSTSLPALGVLDRVQLWPELRIVESAQSAAPAAQAAAASTAAASGAGTAASPATPAANPATPAVAPQAAGAAAPAASAAAAAAASVTLKDLLVAVLLLVVTGIAARNIPGLLEISLQRLPLDSGSRYALSTLCRYAVVILGSTAAFNALDIGWDKVQWLAAALTFGLAFGLQEIFANFVSGLIILLERPVRVGDMVTVGTTSGRVTRLRMRATTILDADRREFLVPNKELITGAVINWTLTDAITRHVVSVGIAYGSDVELARSLLLQAARDTDLVLADPAPTAILRRFGESTLDFDLRVFLPNPDVAPQVGDQLHARIDAAFRAHGIEIAFPQQDVHIRSADGLRDKLPRAERVAEAIRLTPDR
jgi:potassium efflux system protein